MRARGALGFPGAALDLQRRKVSQRKREGTQLTAHPSDVRQGANSDFNRQVGCLFSAEEHRGCFLFKKKKSLPSV